MKKNLIFLFDGTANDATVQTDSALDSFTNVYAINQIIADAALISRNNIIITVPQITFYMPGVGTTFTVRRPSRDIWAWQWGDRVRQKVFGDGLEQLILRAYINLSANYSPGDGIVCVGFSRGAVAARIFTRLISDFGVLTSSKLMMLDRVWNEFIDISKTQVDAEYYEKIAMLKQEVKAAFKSKDRRNVVFYDDENVCVDFLGLFDTVMGKSDDDRIKHITLRDLRPASKVRKVVHLLGMHEVRDLYELKRVNTDGIASDIVREIWIPGVHSDVGGGYPENLIGNVSLLTMAELMKEMGGVELEQSGYNNVVSSIKEKYGLGPMIVNKEPWVTKAVSRRHLVRNGDELHPLHWHLIGKKVYWKGVTLPLFYEDRFIANQNRQDEALKTTFDTWIS